MARAHPFGCEAEASRRHLFDYFSKGLQGGRWELAAACVPQLLNSPAEPPQKLLSLIKAIVCHPYTLK